MNCNEFANPQHPIWVEVIGYLFFLLESLEIRDFHTRA